MNTPSRPFIVTCGDLRVRFTPDQEDGGYTVEALNRKGVYSQGDTFEEALHMIQDADRIMAEVRAEQASERLRRRATPKPAASARGRSVRSRALAGA